MARIAPVRSLHTRCAMKTPRPWSIWRQPHLVPGSDSLRSIGDPAYEIIPECAMIGGGSQPRDYGFFHCKLRCFGSSRPVSMLRI